MGNIFVRKSNYLDGLKYFQQAMGILEDNDEDEKY